MPVIRTKIRPPAPPRRVVARPRLTERIVELHERFGVVWVRGTAGAGKTTAVVEALGGTPLAWLTLDATESAPGRLLVHLEAALARAVPGLEPVASAALAEAVPHVEAAGLLAEAVGDTAVTLVVDELERLADSAEARAALAAFIRYAPPGLRLILISRRAVDLPLRDVGDVGQLTEAELAFSVDEAAEALAAARARAEATPRPPSRPRRAGSRACCSRLALAEPHARGGRRDRCAQRLPLVGDHGRARAARAASS